MEAHIFTEDSSTTADNAGLPAESYFQGLFTQVTTVKNELEQFTTPHLHVFSEDLGVLTGKESPVEVRKKQDVPLGAEESVKMAKEELFRAAETADVMVILFSTDIFRATVAETWDELVAEAKPGSIWCLGAARSALDELNVENLVAKGCSILTYQRVGVARIGSEVREDLFEKVKEKAEQ